MRNGQRSTLLSISPTAALTGVAAGTGYTPVVGIPWARYLVLHANFTYGSGGTTAKVWVQTSIDGGVSWFDIANFAFTTATAKKVSTVVIDPTTPLTAGTTPASAALADNTVLNGVIGDRIRALVTTTGIYAATTLVVDMVAKE